MSVMALDCPHCFVKHVQFQSVAAVRHGLGARVYTLFMVCNSCSGGIGLLLAGPAGDDNPHELRGDLAYSRFAVVDIYPKLTSRLPPEHTPDRVVHLYVQAVNALQREEYDGAGAMCRKVLDVATKLLGDVPGRVALKARIDGLAAQHRITPDLREWAHVIRLDGNDAAHDEEPFTKDDAEQLASFTELFLMYVFTLPGMLAERKAKQTPAA